MNEIYEVKDIKDFNLDHIFDCGQCFRWEKEDNGSYTGIAMGKIVNMSYDDKEKRLTIDNCVREDFEQIWEEYLDLKRDYSYIKKELATKDDVMATAIKSGEGIRILKQELWETMVSFIISQNNNIPRIKGCIEKLASGFGEYVGERNGKAYYQLPSPEKLSTLTVEDLGPCKLGYRALYLIKCAKEVLEYGGMEKLRSDMAISDDPASELQRFTGIGPKVASCIALFGVGKFNSFPIDVWVKRVMNKMYAFDEKDVKGMNKYAQENFGEYGGIAQQYLFYYIRGLEE